METTRKNLKSTADQEARELTALVNHPRVSVEGFLLGEVTNALYRAGEQILRKQGEPESDCCSSCAFLRGSVPNGCFQTQRDALKAVNEVKPFMCHMVESRTKVCRGWFGAVQARKAMQADGVKFVETNYEFSPPD